MLETYGKSADKWSNKKKSAVRSYNIASYRRVVSREQLQDAERFKRKTFSNIFQPTSPLLACSHSPDEFNAHRNLERSREDSDADAHSDRLRDVTNFRRTPQFWWRHNRSGCGQSFRTRPYWLRRGRLPSPLHQSRQRFLNKDLISRSCWHRLFTFYWPNTLCTQWGACDISTTSHDAGRWWLL